MHASVEIVNPGGTGRPALVISARPEPFPPSTSFIVRSPSALPLPKKYTYLRASVFFDLALVFLDLALVFLDLALVFLDLALDFFDFALLLFNAAPLFFTTRAFRASFFAM